jgi:glutaredoxin 3
MKIIIWSKESCPQCEMAKNLLKSKGISFEERKVGSGWTKEQLLEVVPTARAVPQIIMDGQPIGGFESLRQCLGAA